jgi:hypothetical protein
MIITIGAQNSPSLDDADNFRAFKVVCEAERDSCAAQFSQVGRLDGDHLWVDPEWIRRNGRTDGDWLAGLDKMIAYAGSSGWTDASGAIRAHIEDR